MYLHKTNTSVFTPTHAKFHFYSNIISKVTLLVHVIYSPLDPQGQQYESTKLN